MNSNQILNGLLKRRNHVAFAVYWLVVFVLYLPAAEAGRVGDFPGWVHFLTTNNFTDYVNRKGSGIASMYQFTQVVSYFFYHLFGANAWAWHVLYVSMQALNALLLFLFFRQLLEISGINRAAMAAFCGALLFCVSPYISEVVVWEPSFHYLLGLMLMMTVLLCVLQFVLTGHSRYAWWGGIVFFLSSYSLEVFYLTPLFTVTLALHGSVALHISPQRTRRALLFFTLPQAAICALYFVLLHRLYGSGIAHVGTVALKLNADNLSKGLKYIFHIAFLGRFFPAGLRNKVYHFCSVVPALWVFCGIAALATVLILATYKRLPARAKLTSLLLLWTGFSIALILPLSFPETGLVILDRYTYVLDAFLFMSMSVLLNGIPGKWLYPAIITAYSLINVRFTHRVNAYWQQSAHIVNRLVSTFANDPSKKVLLLDLPECLDGVQMIGTRDDGEFRMMYNAIMPQKITNDVYDVEAFYMSATKDGAHTTVLNDSTVRVTLNQWGTWWLYYGLGATSYENSDYKVNMRDEGHLYDVILKHPKTEYLLLYSAGDEWKKVDMNRQGVDQY